MDDPSKFASMMEYNIAIYAIVILIISECMLCFLTSRGRHNSSKKNSDRGTMWLIIIAWCCSLMAGAYFRSQSVPQYMRNWLLPHWTYYMGVILIILGIIIRCTAVFTLKKAFTFSVQTTKEQHLIETGLYSIVRNPAYTGSILSLLGVAFAYRHILGSILVLLICSTCYSIRIKVEEKALKEQFAKEFNNYCSHTRYRLFPGIY